jgi:hypothetical protein
LPKSAEARLSAVDLRAEAFNFRVLFYDPYLLNGVELALGIDRAASLEELLRQTDTLSIHTPLTPETRGLLGHAELGRLRPGAVVINDARGPILDLDALLAHLQSGHIAAAGLDVPGVWGDDEAAFEPGRAGLDRDATARVPARPVARPPPADSGNPRPTRGANRPRRSRGLRDDFRCRRSRRSTGLGRAGSGTPRSRRASAILPARLALAKRP